MSKSDSDLVSAASQRKSPFLLWACLLTFVVLLLGAVGVWKSNNFFFTEKLDYFACSGTLDDEPLLAELNFQKDKDVLALIVFADGRHWSLTKHRVENGRHVWTLLDPESNVVGTLSGEWQARTGAFEGQLEHGLAKKKTSPVSLRQYAQFEHSVSMSGLRIGPFGQRSRFESVLPQVPLDSPMYEALAENNLAHNHVSNFWEDLSFHLQMLPSWQEPDETFVSQYQFLRVTENAVSYKGIHRYATGGATPALASVVVDGGQVQWLTWDEELFNQAESDAPKEKLLRVIYERLNVELKRRGQPELAFSDDEGARAIEGGFTFALEYAGMRISFPPEMVGGKDEYEFLIPWSEARSFLREDGPAKFFMPPK